MIPGDRVTIGVPLDTVRIYVLDDDRNPVPNGVRGELYLAGTQVMRGYLDDATQTAQQVFADPWHPEEHMFRTRDYGTRENDGRLTYHGRMDRVAKIRGFRVELAGVEHAIMSCDNVAHCAAIAVNGSLVAYITFDADCASVDAEKRIADIRQRLSDMLPSPWVPAAILPLKQLPKTPNGKVDSRSLESIYSKATSGAGGSLSSFAGSVASEKLAEQWRQVLQLGPDMKFQDDDDFLRLGGHSILLMLLATRLTAAFGTKIRVRELVTAPSFRGHLDAVESRLKATSAQETPHQTQRLSPQQLTELERQVWFQYQVATTVTTFNIATVLAIRGKADLNKLTDSLNTALASDPVLACTISEGPNGPVRVNSASAPAVCEVTQLDVEAEINHRFDLEHGALIRVHLIRPTSRGHDAVCCRIVIVTSHAIADLGTLQNLLRLTSAAYTGGNMTKHETPQHLDSHKWTHSPSTEEKMFWRNYLSGHSYDNHKPSLLRSVFVPSPLATFRGVSKSLDFSGKVVTSLNKLVRRLGITHHQLALSVAALLLQWLSKEDDIVLGAPNSNRTCPADEEALGQFLDRLPIRVKLAARDDDSSISSILIEVRNSALRALSHAISFSDILSIHGFPNGHLHHPLFECMVTFHTRSSSLENWLQLPGCRVSASPRFANGSKFPLMLEWFELGPDRWSVHLEHDTSYILPGSMQVVEKALGVILDAVADEQSLAELHAQLDVFNLDTDSTEGSSSPPSSPGYDSPRSLDSCYSVSVDEMASTIRAEMAACLGPTSEALSNEDSFFSAGADSLAVMSLRQRMRKLGIDLPMRSIFVGRTPVKLAKLVLV
jgi:aryl carrier-like protein